MAKITSKQQEILEFINEYTLDRGYPPTVREIGQAVQLSSSASVHAQLNKLEDKGLIKKNATASRAITIVKEEKKDTVYVPLVGVVTAGNPIEAIESVTDYFPIPASMSKSNDLLFMLTVSGNSMKNAGIFDHDQILVKKVDTANNGEIVVALTETNEATVKRFFKEDDYIRLQPENEEYEPIMSKDIKVIGKVVGLYRKMS